MSQEEEQYANRQFKKAFTKSKTADKPYEGELKAKKPKKVTRRDNDFFCPMGDSLCERRGYCMGDCE